MTRALRAAPASMREQGYSVKRQALHRGQTDQTFLPGSYLKQGVAGSAQKAEGPQHCAQHQPT